MDAQAVERYVADNLCLAALTTEQKCNDSECFMHKILTHRRYRTDAHWQRFLVYQFACLHHERGTLPGCSRMLLQASMVDGRLRWQRHTQPLTETHPDPLHLPGAFCHRERKSPPPRSSPNCGSPMPACTARRSWASSSCRGPWPP